jgi:serine/threonine protein kinase
MGTPLKQTKTEKEKRKHILKITEAFKKQLEDGQSTGVLSKITDNIFAFGFKASAYISQFNETIHVGKQDVAIKLLGGSAIPIYSMSYQNATVIFRVISEGDIDFSSYQRARDNTSLNKHFPEQYAMESFTHRHSKYYLEIVEYCGRKDLRVANNDVASSIEYVKNMLQIMADLHAAGFCFTDVKPGNFVIADDGHLVLSDVKSLRDVLGKDAIALRELSNNISVAYQSLPASLSNTPNSNDLDQSMVSVQEIDYQTRYSLGISIYEVLTGHFVALEHMRAKAALSELVEQRLVEQRNFDHSEFWQQMAGNAALAVGIVLDKLEKEDLREHLNLEHEVFQSPVGLVLKDIIISFTSQERTQRIEVSEALSRLQHALSLLPTSSAPSSVEEDPNMAASSSISPEPRKRRKQYSQAELPTLFRSSSLARTHEEGAADAPTVTEKRDRFKQSGNALSRIFSSPKKEKGKPVEEPDTPTKTL